MESRVVKDAAQLQAAVADGVKSIEVSGTITGSPRLVLAPGVTLKGGRLEFGSKGVLLTRDNTIEDTEIVVPVHEIAIYADATQQDWGTLTMRRVATVGQVAIIASDAVRAGHVDIDGLVVKAADVRGRADRPRGFGVEALQGALTVWNRNSDPSVEITADIKNVSAGFEGVPVRGSGVFVGGHGTDDGKAFGGTLRVSTLSTLAINTDGGIAEATPDLISGGVFVISGAVVENVTNEGPVTTHGPNDMVLDNWGDVRTWTARQPITSYGASGIGFVNFSDIKRLSIEAPIRTYGSGARGFNLYDGSLEEAVFESIETHGDGSIGIQLSRPLAKLTINKDLSTEGGEGLSLVKGVQVTLKAIALSIKSGGALNELHIGGVISTAGDDVVSVELADKVGSWDVADGIVAKGRGSDAVHYSGRGAAPAGVKITSERGTDIVKIPAAP